MIKISQYFEELLKDLQVRTDTRAYILGIFEKYKTSTFDLSQDNIVLLFSQARFNHDFLIYQNIGDWILFKNSLFNIEKREIENNFARLSYDACYRLIDRKWLLFQELADDLIKIENQIKYNLRDIVIR